MRLLVVSQYFWPEDFRINDFVVGMRERGCEVTVLTGWPNYPDGQVFEDFRRNPGAFSRFGDVDVVRVPMIARGSNAITLILNYLTFALSASMLGAWKLRGQSYDAIFVFQISPVTAVLPALLLRRLKHAPVLTWVLDLWPETLEAVGVIRSRRVLSVVGMLVHFIYRRCDRILIQSEAFMDSVLAYGGRRERTLFFPNWIEPTFEAGLEGVTPAPELAPFAGTFNVMFTGNIGEAQDMPALVEAALATQDLDNLRWLIVGEGRGSHGLRAAIVRHRLEDRVVLLGRHPVARMPAFLVGAHALLVSLRAEPVFMKTVPGKLQNYMAAGKPVLGMIDGEAARVIVESGGGLASPASDGAALAVNVRSLMAATGAKRDAMGRAARTYALRHFHRRRLFDAFVDWAREANRDFR